MTEKKRYGRRQDHYPHLWCTGPDPRRHDQYIAWLRHRAQAHYRGELYSLTFEDWETVWNQDSAWENRGRSIDSVCLTMIDSQKGWCSDNVVVQCRRETLRQHGFARVGMKYRRRTHDKVS